MLLHKKYIAKHKLHHEQSMDCVLHRKGTTHTFVGFKPTKHQIHTVSTTKIG